MRFPCVLARIYGGLGNQLFMYATARALASRNGAELFLDAHSGFKYDTYQHHFGLDRFQISGKIVRPSILTAPGLCGRAFRSGLRRVNHLLPISARKYLTEPASAGYEVLARIRIRRLIVLEGYWQDERYFADFRTVLKRELVPIDHARIADGELAREIQSQEGGGVCIHIRAYDDLERVSGGRYDRAVRLPVDYFRDALEIVQSHVGVTRCFVFSDNPERAKTVFKDRHRFRVVDNETEGEAHRDLWLMSLCRHHVLSNSTFSWWGRWLSGSDGVVVAPNTERWQTVLGLPPVPEDWRSVLL